MLIVYNSNERWVVKFGILLMLHLLLIKHQVFCFTRS